MIPPDYGLVFTRLSQRGLVIIGSDGQLNLSGLLHGSNDGVAVGHTMTIEEGSDVGTLRDADGAGIAVTLQFDAEDEAGLPQVFHIEFGCEVLLELTEICQAAGGDEEVVNVQGDDDDGA